MSDESPSDDPVREKLLALVGKPIGDQEKALAPEPVNTAMINHWIDAFDDRNPVYEFEEAAAESIHNNVVAPPAMMQTWTMPRPIIEGIAERGGSPVEVTNNPLEHLDEAGYTATLATNSELEFDRYLNVGDHLESQITLESISEQKKTGLGLGYFVTWLTTYTDTSGEVVGRQRFRVLKFNPATMGGA